MIPSTKTLKARLNLTHEKALTLRKLLDGRLDPMEFESVRKWVSQCYHTPKPDDLILCAANELLETHGVEALRGQWLNNYYGDCRYSYCNSGDSYTQELMRDHAKGRWIVASCGDIVERDRAMDDGR